MGAGSRRQGCPLGRSQIQPDIPQSQFGQKWEANSRLPPHARVEPGGFGLRALCLCVRPLCCSGSAPQVMRSVSQATQPLGTSGLDKHESKETPPVEVHTNNLDQPELDGTWMRFLSDSVGSPSLGLASTFKA